MKGHASISPIYRLGQPNQEIDPFVTFARIDALRRKAWRELGVISLKIDELPEELREPVKQWAEREYGRR